MNTQVTEIENADVTAIISRNALILEQAWEELEQWRWLMNVEMSGRLDVPIGTAKAVIDASAPGGTRTTGSTASDVGF